MYLIVGEKLTATLNRYVYFPFQLSWRKIWAVLFYLGGPKSNQMVSCKTLACSFSRIIDNKDENVFLKKLGLVYSNIKKWV